MHPAVFNVRNVALSLLAILAMQGAHGGYSVYEKVHDFGTTAASSGGRPNGGLVQGSDGWFYGTTSEGGEHGAGTVFRMSPLGVVETLHSFESGSGSGTDDGGNPQAGLTRARDGHLYGVTQLGGAAACGTIFRVRSDGVYEYMLSLRDETAGCWAFGRLLLAADGQLYGTTALGAPSRGTVFRYRPAKNTTSIVKVIGGEPIAGLIQGSDGLLYGTQYVGGLSGAVFSMRTDGKNFEILKALTGGADGALVSGALTEGSDGLLFGMAEGGGNEGRGTIFRLTKKKQFKVLYAPATDDGPHLFKSSELYLDSDGSLYGVSWYGGAFGESGTIFKLDPKTRAVTTLKTFDGFEGCHPSGALTLGADGNLYGTAAGCGDGQVGIAFRLVPAAAQPAAVSDSSRFMSTFDVVP